MSAAAMLYPEDNITFFVAHLLQYFLSFQVARDDTHVLFSRLFSAVRPVLSLCINCCQLLKETSDQGWKQHCLKHKYLEGSL